MHNTHRFDIRTFLGMVAATVAGLLWANYNRTFAVGLADDMALRPHVWTIFAIPFALCIGWAVVRWREIWLALAVCFCLYFFSTFVAARYESCTVVTGSFNLGVCFTSTSEAQELARQNGHAIYFGSILVIQALAALAIAVQRALAPRPQPNPSVQPQSLQEA